MASLRALQVDEDGRDGGGSGRVARASSSGSAAGLGGAAAAALAALGSSDESEPDDLEVVDAGAVAALRELCSDAAGDEFLAHVLVRRHAGDAEVRPTDRGGGFDRRCAAGDACCPHAYSCWHASKLTPSFTTPHQPPRDTAQAAALWLVERDVAAEQDAWRAAREEAALAAQRAQREREKSKASILARFDLRAVPQAADGRRERPPPEAWAAGKQQQAGKQKIRYREGVIVSSSGEKYVVQKTTPDWDGGSKGKVYTKGKRGKGFV